MSEWCVGALRRTATRTLAYLVSWYLYKVESAKCSTWLVVPTSITQELCTWGNAYGQMGRCGWAGQVISKHYKLTLRQKSKNPLK